MLGRESHKSVNSVHHAHVFRKLEVHLWNEEVHAVKKTHKNLEAYASFWVGEAGAKCPPPPSIFISKYSFVLGYWFEQGQTKNWIESGGKGVFEYYGLVQIKIPSLSKLSAS